MPRCLSPDLCPLTKRLLMTLFIKRTCFPLRFSTMMWPVLPQQKVKTDAGTNVGTKSQINYLMKVLDVGSRTSTGRPS